MSGPQRSRWQKENTLFGLAPSTLCLPLLRITDIAVRKGWIHIGESKYCGLKVDRPALGRR